MNAAADPNVPGLGAASPSPERRNDWIDVVGIGAAGFSSLPAVEAALVTAADVVLGAQRMLDSLPEPPVSEATGAATQERRAWPSPLLPALPGLLEDLRGRRVVVLASGDPLLSGIGSTLLRLIGPERIRIHPALSSVTLARARMNWPAETHETVSLVSAPVATLHRWLTPQARLLLLSAGAQTPGQVAALLCEAGWPTARLTVLSDLGTEREALLDCAATDFDPEQPLSALNVIALDLGRTKPETQSAGFGLGVTPGLPDDAFEHDGQLTKWELRIVALARLRPLPGQLLWDLGAGAGSISIEWTRAHPTCRAIAVERDPDRADGIRRNAEALGVPRAVDVRQAVTRASLVDLPDPDAVFIGGGASAEVIGEAWRRLPVGGRLVAHAVTLETERVLLDAHRQLGGELRRISVDRAEPLGTLTSWTPARPVVHWAAVKLAQ